MSPLLEDCVVLVTGNVSNKAPLVDVFKKNGAKVLARVSKNLTHVIWTSAGKRSEQVEDAELLELYRKLEKASDGS